MKDKTLLKISLISSLVGILILLILSTKLEINESFISNIDKNDIGSTVKIEGVVSDVKIVNSTIIMNVAQLDEMMVVVFNSDMILNRGDYVEVTGKMDEYNGNIELIADKIVLK